MRDRVHLRVVHQFDDALGLRMAPGYTPGMKTAISIPDDLFREADRLAAETGQSRSQLYSTAVREYVGRHSTDSVTAALDAVYGTGEHGAEFASEAEFLRVSAAKTLGRSEW
jgi:predicted transcriptional regulator